MNEPKARFCGACGEPLAREARFCPSCGAPIQPPAPASPATPLPPLPGTPAPVAAPPAVRATSGNRTLLIIGGLVVAVVLVAGFVATRPDDVPANRLTADGLGPLRIGMSVDEALATGWIEEDEDDVFGIREACGYGSVTDTAAVDPDDVSVLFLDGDLSLISAYGDSVVVGPGDLRVGSDESELRAAFGDGIEENVDIYGSTHLDVIEGDAGMSFQLAVDESGSGEPTISYVEAGNTAGLSLVEGCA